MTTAITHVLTWLRGEQVGVDSEGNKYYHERRVPTGRRRRRWVVYDGVEEASRVPPDEPEEWAPETWWQVRPTVI